MIKKFHHVGIAVRDLEQALAFYRDVLGLPIHKIAEAPDQGVKAALLRVGHSEIELLEPLSPTSPVGRFLERKGEGLHHVCFETDDAGAELNKVKGQGVELIDAEPRLGLAGMICFLHPRSNHGVLVEFAQPID